MKDDLAEDNTLGKIIASKLRAQLRTEETGCPEGETLAAFVERALTPSERLASETHLTTCARCQEQVAELARLGQTDEPVVVAEKAAPARVRARNFWYFRLAWAAPVLLALVVAGLWYTGEFRHLLRQPQESALAPPAPAPAPEAATEPEGTPPAPGLLAKRAIPQALPRAKEAAKPAVAVPSPVSKAARAELRREPASLAGAAARAERFADAGPGAIATPGERARLAAAVPPAARVGAMEAKQRKDERAEHAAAPVFPPSAALESGRQADEESPAYAKGREVGREPALPGLSVLSSTPKTERTWRVGRRGLIQRADPSGFWVTVASGVEEDLYDITFPSPAVGWAVGQGGIVLRTTDGGTNWGKIPSPISEDLVRVSASSTRVARVMTRSGQTLATTDGGKTWTSSRRE